MYAPFNTSSIASMVEENPSLIGIIGNEMKSLILDDEFFTAQTIARMVKRQGCGTRFVTDSTHFFVELEQWQPDIIFLDLKMPDMDGVQIIQKLAEINSQAKLILMSGGQEKLLELAQHAAKEHGLSMVGYLPKPFSSKQLTQMLDQAQLSLDTPSSKVWAGPASRLPTANDLRQALKNNELEVYYQAKISSKSETLIGFEALARWRHPQLGFVAPDYFIALAEKNNLIDELTRLVAAESIEWLAKMSTDEMADKLNHHTFQSVCMSLNLSAQSLSQTQLFDWLVSCCQQHNVAPNRIILEITETTVMHHAAETYDNLARLSIKGFGLSIDDFGTGYSSLSQLVKLPYAEIKIDKSFVVNASTNPESRAVITSIVELAKSLGLKTTAEGVEDRTTLQFLKSLGCDLCQGYAISRPVNADGAVEWFIAHEKQLEDQRAHFLNDLKMLYSPREERFDRLTRVAAEVFDLPIAMFNLMDSEVQWSKSNHGFIHDQVNRHESICNIAIQQDQPLIYSDLQNSVLFAGCPLVTGHPHIRFYAGQPISHIDGGKVGVMCVLDNRPREFNEAEKKKLATLSAIVEKEVAYTHSSPVNNENDHSLVMPFWHMAPKLKDDIYLSSALDIKVGMLCVKIIGIEKLILTQGAAVAEKLSNVIAALIRKHCDIGLLGFSSYGLLVMSVIGQKAERLNDLKPCLISELKGLLADKSQREQSLDFNISTRVDIARHELTVEGLIEQTIINDTNLVSMSSAGALS